jgi:hypothetical protein
MPCQRWGVMEEMGIGEEAVAGGRRVSHPVLRPNRMLIVCVPMNQVYTHTV